LYSWLWSSASIVRELLPWLWAVLIAGLVFWWVRSLRLAAMRASSFGRLPTLARVLHAGQLATFTEVMALLLEQQVSMDEAILLASGASGNAQLTSAGQKLAEAVRAGATGDEVPAAIPPLLGWLILTGAQQQQLVKTLRQSAANYRRRATFLATWLGVYLPIFLSAFIGGSVVLMYVLLTLIPFYNLLYALS
jgi:type II secretory pathway component PulF